MAPALFVRAIEQKDLETALAIANLDPISNCYLVSKLENWHGIDQQLLLVTDRNRNLGIAYIGINATTANCSYEMLTHLADYLNTVRSVSSSIVGLREDVFGLWEQISSLWGPPRLIREDQPLLELTSYVQGDLNPEVRAATIEDLDLVLPAAANMFREEVGIDPMKANTRTAYRNRISELLNLGRTYILLDGPEIIFKADVGVLSSEVIQVQGVWVAPQYRGLRISGPALAQAINLMQQDHAPRVSLYVNDFNTRALRLYRALGFTQVGTFASVML
ncbi:MAG: hypothetical protein RL587_1212 [Actinomycetota bacterium]|jgi:hypothetical protein